MTPSHPLESVIQLMRNGTFPSKLKTFEQRKTIFFPGDPAERVYFLFEGAVKLSRIYESGEEITVALLRENSVFGVLSFLTQQSTDRFYHAVTFTRTKLLSVPAKQLEHAMRYDPELSMVVLKGLSSRLLETEMMIETLAYKDILSRLMSFILILCRNFGVPDGTGITVDLKLSQQQIAEAIGSTRVTITRLLGELRDQGHISIENKKIIVHNPIQFGKELL